MPEVSVVVPTYDRWPLLSRALASVLAQRGVDLELIVVDDCSPDDTPQRLAALGDPRLRVIRQEERGGVARARNRGISEARGTFVAFLDDDDFWAPTRLKEHLDAMRAERASWGYGAAIVIGPTGAIQKVMMPAAPQALRAGLLEANVVGPPSTATVRLDLLRACGGFDERLSVVADWDLYIRLERRTPPARCAVPLVAYSEHENNMHRLHRPERALELEYLAEKHSHLMPAGRRFGARAVERQAAGDARLAGRRFAAARSYIRIGMRERSSIDVLRGLGLFVGEGPMAKVRRVRRRGASVPPWLSEAAAGSMEPDLTT